MLDHPTRTRRAALAATALLTAVGFLLRIKGINQSLAGDEYYSYREVMLSGSLGALWHNLQNSIELTPPLYPFLAWISKSIVYAPESLRWPSVAASTALIPAVWVLGDRVGGLKTGVLAAALATISPFAIWYSNEARSYAVLSLTCVLALIAVLRFAEQPNRARTVLLSLAGAAVLYSHASGSVAMLGAGGWLLVTRPDLRRRTIMAATATLLMFAPFAMAFHPQNVWYMLGQLRGSGVYVVTDHLQRMIAGTTAVSPNLLPGMLSVSLLVAIVIIGSASRQFRIGTTSNPTGLLLFTIATSLTCLYAYSLATNVMVMTVRSLNSLLGAALVLLATAAVNARPRALAAVLAATALIVMTASGARSLQVSFLRSDVNAAVDAAASLRPPATIVMNMHRESYSIYLPPKSTNKTLNLSPSRAAWKPLTASKTPVVWLTTLHKTTVTKALLVSWLTSATAQGRTNLCSRSFDGNPSVLVLTAWPSGAPALRRGDCDLNAFNRAVALAPLKGRNPRRAELDYASQRPAPSDLVMMAVLAAALALLGGNLWTLRRREASRATEGRA
ncbi:MAG: glycosyltransferase family 39 protein [Solirubrobacterales bacterium]|nr:glycosyltransferase family 39 protein [Solirubrobacterales bacterium]